MPPAGAYSIYAPPPTACSTLLHYLLNTTLLLSSFLVTSLYGYLIAFFLNNFNHPGRLRQYHTSNIHWPPRNEVTYWARLMSLAHGLTILLLTAYPGDDEGPEETTVHLGVRVLCSLAGVAVAIFLAGAMVVAWTIVVSRWGRAGNVGADVEAMPLQKGGEKEVLTEQECVLDGGCD